MNKDTKEVYMTSLVASEPNINEFKEIVKDIISNPNVRALRDKVQHKSHSRFYHCLRVSYHTYSICKKRNLDYVSAARGALLHDFYYYDWRNKNVEGQKRFHAFRHPKIALRNANDLFDLNDIEKDIIVKHMWPLTVKLPKYKETYIVTAVDKYCATKELLKNCELSKLKLKKLIHKKEKMYNEEGMENG